MHDWGAFEIALRYSELDLNDGPVKGGKEDDWTIGANWYLGTHWKLQANYVWANSTKFYGNPLNADADVDPRIFEVRAQVYF
jgi:phosphate-selective porin OprO/OprP